MQLLLISFTLLTSILCGRILNGDLWVDYANAGSMTQLSFSFMLSNPINQWDYIKVALPFPLHSSLVPAYPATEGLSIPLELAVTYQYVDGSSNINSTVYTCQTLTQTIDSSNYYIRFYNNDRKTLIPIPDNQWFHLKFKITGTSPLQYQKSSSILQIQISTVSSVWTNSMVYDDNLAFNYFQLAPAPTKSITLSATPYAFGSAGGYLLTQAVYSMYLDVTTNLDTYQFQQNLKLVFLINQTNSYAWTGTCSSVAKTNAPTIAQLNVSLYTCTVDTVNNIMTVLLTPAALTAQTSFRFTVQVRNPPVVITGVDIIVRAVKEVSGVILSYGSATAALNTNQIYITYQQIFVGWGLRPDALLPFDAPIFRGNAASPTYMPYNSLTTKFRISQSTSSSTQLRIQINIPSQSSAFVLETGYTHNLPSYPNKQARCVVEYSTDTVKRKIACTGIGALNSATYYYIGWKMFFPYDNYQSAIDCTKFGLITVYSALTITSEDNLFVLGRGDPFLTYLKSSPNYYVIGRNSSYISYMKTFANLNMMVLSSDFQQFLQTPEQVIVTNRPDTYSNKIFNDIYVIGQNLAFMTYLQLFPDLYIAYQLKSNSDITKGYLSTPLIATSMPKNTLSIKTYNSQDWAGYSLNTNPVISSSTSSGTLTTSEGLKIQSGTNQALVFSMQALYSTVTSASSSASTITNNWGMLIMLNPKIKLNAASVTLTESSLSLTATAVTIDSNSSYNKYTLITLKGTTPSRLQTSFKTTAVKTVFSLFPFLISDFSSIFADQNNFDVMIATVDGIDGPLNRMTFNGYFLYNGFTMMNTAAITTINSGFVAYSHTSQLDGSTVPTMMRVKGNIASATNFYALCIFFDQLAPYFSNYHNGDIYCKTTDPINKCKYKKGAQSIMTSYDYLNYHTFSRFQIQLANPTTAFDILIPVKATQGKIQTYYHLGYITKDPTTGKLGFAYISPRKTITHSGTAATGGTFGPILTSVSLGQVLTSMNLKAIHSGVTTNSFDNLGGAFLYFSEWDYFGGVTPTGWSNGQCYIINYLLYSTNYASYLAGSSFIYKYKNMNGVVCFTDNSNSISSAQLIVANSTIPTRWGLTLPGTGAYSQNNGNLMVTNVNYMNVPTNLQITNTSTIKTPTMGPNLVKSVGVWIIPLPVALQASVKIRIIGDSSANLPFTTTGGTCGIYVAGVKTTVGCVCTTTPTQVDYMLTIIQSDLLPVNSNMQIVHYGLNTNSTYNTTTFSFKVYSLLTTNNPNTNEVIFYANNVSFPYGIADSTYIGGSQIRLSSYTQITNNKAAITSFYFSFSVLGKGLYVTNRVRINLGQYHLQNSASQINPTCSIYRYTQTGPRQFSHDWAAIDATQGFNMLDFWPEKDLLSNNLTYTVKCINFAAISTSSAVGISGRVVNTTSDLTGQVITTTSISLATLPSMTQTNQITATKSFTIPSTYMQIQFTVTSPGITTDSILYIGFPSYYANGLGPDIKCYSTYEIWCSVTDRQLMVRYMGTFSQGTSFVITVAGVQQPVNYNSGTFYFVIDNDDNPTVVISSSTFVDSVSTSVLDTQNFPAFQILSMTQSSAYLRQQNVVLILNFYVPSTLSSVTVGQYLFLVFPPNFANILRFITPSCQLNIRGNTLKNYISSCSVTGMRLKMPFLDSLTLGSVYTLTVNGIINPTDPSSNTYKYALQITNPSGNTIAARTYSPHANFQMPIFILNPMRVSLDYYTASNGLITQLSTTANIQSQQVFIASSASYLTSSYSRNVYLSPVSNLYSFPSSLVLLSGQNPFPIRFSALTSGVNYIYFQKSGDGSFYSSLPPLVLSINKNYFTPVSFLETQYNLPVAPVNTNYTIGVNLPFNLYPMSQVNLTVTLTPGFGISLRNNPTVIQFFPQKTSATISLYVNDATLWTNGTTTNMTITPSSTSTYAGPTIIPIVATAAVVANPSLTLVLNSTNHKSAAFQVTCGQQGRFIYHVSRLFSYNTTACSMSIFLINHWIQQSSISALRVSQVYYNCEDILGMSNIVTPGTSQTITINNLKASTTYQIEGFCISQIGTTSSLTKRSFSTISNGGYVSKMDFVFSTQLTIAQKIKASCALALLFNINYLKVSTVDGYYCSELLSARLLQQQHSSKPLKINQQQQNVPSIRRRLSVPTNRIQFYFGINNDLTTDTSPTRIQAYSVNQTTLINQFSSVVGLTSVVSMTTSLTSYVGANDVASSSIYVDVGPNYFYIHGMTMPNNGIIYVIVGDNTVWPRAPVISQIKKGSGPNGLPPIYYKVLGYRTSQPVSSYAAFKDLSSSNYTIYIVGSDDNPFDNANFGTIRSFPIYAEVPTWQNMLFITSILTILFVMF